MAFACAPWGATSTMPLSFEVALDGSSSPPEGTVFDVYQVRAFADGGTVSAVPESVGTATVGPGHRLLSDPGGTLSSLLVLVLAPR